MPPTIVTYFSFSELNNGVKATIEEFRAELSKFNAIQVLYACGVMNSMTRDWQGNTRPGVVEELVRNSFQKWAADQIIAELHNPRRPRGLYHRQQFLFVAKESLSYCPTTGGKNPLLPEHSGEMARVLLMANDLLHKGLTEHLSTAEQMMNVMSEFIPIAEANGFNRPMHKILRSHIMIERFLPDVGGEIHGLFQRTTGVPLEDYFALCFATLCRYVDLDFKKYQADPSLFVLSSGWYRTTPIGEPIIANFLTEISAAVSEFKDALTRGSKEATDFTCFRAKPYLRDELNHLLIDPIFLAEKSESGVFWSINNGLRTDQRAQFHQDWGLAFEQYINWLMEESVDEIVNKFHPNPKFSDNGEEVCDAMMLCGDSVVFIESKGATFTVEAKYGTNPAKLREEIEKKVVESSGHKKGIAQLAVRIEQVFCRSRPRKVEGVDLSRVVKVYPVLITRDDIGAALVFNAYLAARFRELFRRKRVSVTVTPPFSLSAQDVEMLCGYLPYAGLTDLLEQRYRAQPSLLSSFWLVDNPIINRLGNRECKPFADAMHTYVETVKERLFPGLEVPEFL
jgi:hypothetical protein